ncbi:helix-turn-helix domain-containing protein [Bosea sp. (in: a-proteobacteria)]|uniref:MarR family transcriptional regulator n=1 Tax=Bosea sp. (in: a-proteobacteria) TaxID=1871050 RepID=UPI002B45E604|nr:helix-turn-helix domain-containing protein [Bosea sp. (in: a-proteobacteria)]WRH59175.1 MAG: helix-turn-helix domain-containing protein [Bosea sp. (in: a-proteobacteria)]
MNIHDVPVETVRRVNAYLRAAPYRTTGRYDWRIPALVAESWVTAGASPIYTNDLARRFGASRRTICTAIQRLVAGGVIRQAGTSADGRRLYEPCLDIGEAAFGPEQRHVG